MLIKYAGKYVKIYFIIKITCLFIVLSFLVDWKELVEKGGIPSS